ncbi:MAG: alpha/beta hydrolase, partial [Actinomycetota bacterium]|nr:alpha/beta hydrolase [Actinomycetota bacterium]
MNATHDLIVPVEGGELAVAVYGADDADALTVLAIHGITASSRSWQVVAQQLGERVPGGRLLAPDLRGRGRSGELSGPFGLRRHAEDLARVIEHEELGRVQVVGHSMGGFVAVALADLVPDAVAGLVLVDGGFPLELPAGADAVDIAAALGPAAARLQMEFADVESALELWRAHPAFAHDWRPEVEDYVRYDLRGEAPQLRSSASGEAMLEDGAEFYGEQWYLDALRGLSMPVTVLRAP